MAASTLPQALLSPQDAADFLCTTPGNLAVLRCKRQGPKYIKLGKSVRYAPADLIAYIESRTVSPVTADAQ